MPERWTRAVLRLRLVILVCWLAALAAGVWASFALPDLLSSSFVVPGSDSARAQAILEREFGERPDGTFVVVFPVSNPSDERIQAQLQRRLASATRSVPTGRASEIRRGAGLLYGDVETRLALQDAKRYTDDLRRALRGSPAALVTGQPAIQHDVDPVFASDLRRAEAVAVPLALLALVAVLGVSLAVAIPFVFAACTIGATLACVAVVAHHFPTATYVTNLVELIGLGLAIDYSLLVVHRFREELDRGDTIDEAVVRTMATAGRTVVFSGVAVAVGLALLLLVPVPLIRSVGVGGLLIPLVSIAAAVTLQPVLLSLLGRRGMRRVPIGARLAPRTGGPEDPERGAWARLARVVTRRPVPFLVAGTAVLVAAAIPALALDVSPGSLTDIPGSLPSARGAELLRAGVGQGAVAPTIVVADGGAGGAMRSGPTWTAVDRLADALFHDPEVFVVATGRRPPYVDDGRRYARVVVAGRNDFGAEETRRLVHRIREELIPAAGFPEGARVWAGGAPAQGVDFLARAYGAFPWIVLAVLAITYLGLLRAFRSLVLPLKAIVLNILTVAAVFGLLVVVFQWSAGGRLLGLHEGEVEAWVPIFLFATLFGLSMDYEVFLVSRMRESWDHVHDNARAVAHGLERTGRIITAAALIMVAAFSGFVAGRIAGLQQLGVGLVLGILLDATIVRAILVPSLMAVLGRWNWWLPAPVARLARIKPSPLQP